MGEVIELSSHRKASCPVCGSKNSVPILWGFPAPEAIEAELRGELVLGGCMPGDHEWYCKDCDASWSSRKAPRSPESPWLPPGSKLRRR